MFLVLSDRTVDLGTRRVRTDDEVVDLTPREADLLACLLEHAGRTVSRDALLAEVWGMTRPVVTRCVDTAVRRLRVKLEAEPSSPRHLVSVPGEGYRLEVQRPAEVSVDGRETERARLLAALQVHGRVHVVGPPGCGAEALVRRTAAGRGWTVGDDGDLRLLRATPEGPPAGREVVLAPAPPGAPVVPLGPLPPTAARDVLLRACQRLGLIGEPQVRDLLRWCDPLPTPLDRVADWLQIHDTPAVVARLRDPVAAFPDLAEALGPAWEVLEPSTRQALAAIAATEGPLPAEAVHDVLGVPHATVDRLVRAGWLSATADGLQPSRLQRAWIRDRQPAPEAHRRWATWLPGAWLDAIRQARRDGLPLPHLPAEALDAAFDTCLAHAPGQAARLCRALDAVHIDAGHPPTVLARFDEVLAHELDPDDRALLLRLRGTARRRAGRLRAAFEDLDQAVRAARDAEERGMALAWRATLHQVAWRWEEAAADLRQALEHVTHPRQHVACHTALAVLQALLGDEADAMARAREAVVEALDQRHPRLEILADRCLGTVLVEVGDIVEARPRLERAARRAHEVGAERQRVQCLRDLARLALDAGQPAQAIEILEQAQDLADGTAYGWIDADLAEIRALAEVLDGDAGTGRTWLERSLVLRTDEDPHTAGTALIWLSLWHATVGDPSTAGRLATRAHAMRWPGRVLSVWRDEVDDVRERGRAPEGPGRGWHARVLRRWCASYAPDRPASHR